MDHFRSLYKANPTTSPKKCKRKEANEIRANKRSELYTSTRNISPSPSSRRGHCPRIDQKENCKPLNLSEAEKLPEAQISGAPSAKRNEKLTRQKAHILKFLAWKTEKAKQAQIKEKSKRAPFVVSTRNCAAIAPDLTNNIKKSFAPANHTFRPPATLQSLELKVIDSNSMRLINGTREETYHFLVTPKKNINKFESGASAVYKNQISRAAIVKPTSDKRYAAATRVTKMPLNNKPVLANVQGLSPKQKGNPLLSKPKSVLPPVKRSTFKATKKGNSSISGAFKVMTGTTHFGGTSTVKLNGKSVLNTPAGPSKVTKTIAAPATDANRMLKAVTSTKIKSLPLKESGTNSVFVGMEKLVQPVDESTTHPADSHTKSVPGQGTVIVKTPAPSKRVTKINLNPKPKLGNKANVQAVPPITKLNSVLLKPKSVMPPIKRSTFKAPKKLNSSISNAFMAVTVNNHSRRGAPTVKLNGKSVLKTLVEVGKPLGLNPETPTDANQVYPFLNVVTSTKRKSVSSKESSANSLFVEMDQLVSPVDDATAHPVDGDKFNFLRYSVVQSDASKSEDEVKTKVADEVYITPDKAAIPQTPTTYLSPYVSVSRGKVGIKIEREKRDSVYMSVDKSVQENADTTAKTRHTMATVHYYRKQLKDEIARLNGQCDAWQQYKEANTHLIEDTGSDMINVTIGQTKLLTTKKLKQFGDLIDRCEDGAMGKKLTGHGDGAKPILTEDLEGFWSMVGLQIENVDKRFENLKRWKENGWKDPDEVPAKSTNSNSNIKKMKKVKPGSTAGPNRDLQKILRNAQVAFMRKKTANSELNEDIILTPSKSRQVLIRDRRSRSAAATVITVNTPKASRKPSAFDQTTPTGTIPSTKILPHIHGFRKSINLLSTLFNKQEKKSPGAIHCASPLALSRKSILKTPGSKRRSKSVIFHSPTIQFTMEDKVENESPPQSISRNKLKNEEEEERTYSLRTRNIKLRDLADIIIPE